MKFMVVVHPEKDGIWTVECPSIPGCVSQGSTKDGALKSIAEAIARCLKVRDQEGLPSPLETRESELVD